MRNRNESSPVSWLAWIIGIVSIAIIVVFGYALLKEKRKKDQVNQEIDKLKEQAQQIEKENMSLEEKIAYLKSRDYQEAQAKDKLNLKNPNENVVIIAEGPVKKEEEKEEAKQNTPTSKGEDLANYKKWLKYFFD